MLILQLVFLVSPLGLITLQATTRAALEPGHAAAAAAAVARAVAAEAAAVDAASRAGKAEAAAYAASQELEKLRSAGAGTASRTAAKARAGAAGEAAPSSRRRNDDHRMSLDRPNGMPSSEPPVVSPSGVSDNGLFQENEPDAEKTPTLELYHRRVPRMKVPNSSSLTADSTDFNNRHDDVSKLTDALCEAAITGDLPQLRALLQLPTAFLALNGGPSTSSSGGGGGGYMSPLARAARENQAEAAELLLEAGAHVNGGTGPDNSNDDGGGGDVGTTGSVSPLFAAAEAGAEDTLALLLRWGADPNSPSNWGHPGHRVRSDGAASDEGTPPVLAAVLGGHANCLAILLRDGCANPEGSCESRHSSSSKSRGCESQGTRPLFAAAATGNFPAAQLLLDHGAKVDLPSGKGTSGNLTPLYIAAHQGHADVVQLLLERGAHPQSTAGHSSPPPFHSSRRSGKLSSSSAKHSAAAANQKTPLHAAASRGHVKAVSALLAGGAGLARLDGKNRTPEQCALSNGHTACAALLSNARQSLENYDDFLAEDGYQGNSRQQGRLAAVSDAAETASSRGLPHQRLWRAPPSRSLEAFVDNGDEDDIGGGGEYDNGSDDDDDEEYNRLMLRPSSPHGSPRSPRSPRALQRLAAGSKEPLTPPPVALSPASRFYGVSASVLSSIR